MDYFNLSPPACLPATEGMAGGHVGYGRGRKSGTKSFCTCRKGSPGRLQDFSAGGVGRES